MYSRNGLAQPIRATGKNGSGQFDPYFFDQLLTSLAQPDEGYRIKRAEIGENLKIC